MTSVFGQDSLLLDKYTDLCKTENQADLCNRSYVTQETCNNFKSDYEDLDVSLNTDKDVHCGLAIISFLLLSHYFGTIK